MSGDINYYRIPFFIIFFAVSNFKLINMPFLRFHSTETSRLAEVSREMTDRIQRAVDCPRETIVLEVVYADVVQDGNIISGEWPFVEVSWFKRGLEIQDEVAAIICDCLKKAGYENSDVHFTYLTARNYYENGKNLGE